jgi:hypothetical protein
MGSQAAVRGEAFGGPAGEAVGGAVGGAAPRDVVRAVVGPVRGVVVGASGGAVGGAVGGATGRAVGGAVEKSLPPNILHLSYLPTTHMAPPISSDRKAYEQYTRAYPIASTHTQRRRE